MSANRHKSILVTRRHFAFGRLRILMQNQEHWS